MKIIKFPNTCSAFNFSQISEFDNIKEEVETTINNHSKLGHGQRLSAIYAFILKRNKVIYNNFINAGFKEVSHYLSNNHGNRKVSLMFRRVSNTEMTTGIPKWKIYKARTLRSKGT